MRVEYVPTIPATETMKENSYWGNLCARFCYAVAGLSEHEIDQIIDLVEDISECKKLEAANDEYVS